MSSAVTTPPTLPATVTRDNPLVPVSVRQDLAVVSKASNENQETFDKLTAGRGDYIAKSTLQRFNSSASASAGDLFPGVFASGIAAGVAAAVSGLFFGGDIALIAATVVGSVGSSIAPSLMITSAMAKRQKKKAAEKLVPLEALAPTLARLESSKGVERAFLQQTVRAWQSDLVKNRALSPEARVALERAVQREDQIVQGSPEADAALRERVEVLKELVEVLNREGIVDTAYLTEVDARIERVPEGERSELMQAVAEQLDPRAQSYEGKHALYDLKIKYGLV